MTMVHKVLLKQLQSRVQNPLPIISVRILDGYVDGEQMDRNSPRPTGLFPMLGRTHLILQTAIHLLHPATCYILIPKVLEMEIEDMKASIPQ